MGGEPCIAPDHLQLHDVHAGLSSGLLDQVLLLFVHHQKRLGACHHRRRICIAKRHRRTHRGPAVQPRCANARRAHEGQLAPQQVRRRSQGGAGGVRGGREPTPTASERSEGALHATRADDRLDATAGRWLSRKVLTGGLHAFSSRTDSPKFRVPAELGFFDFKLERLGLRLSRRSSFVIHFVQVFRYFLFAQNWQKLCDSDLIDFTQKNTLF